MTKRLLATALLGTLAISAQQYVISTFAGGVPPPTPIAGVRAFIGQALGVAADSHGNVYFSALNCVFKLDSNSIVTRVAGNSRAGFSGDGGPAIQAQLNAPLLIQAIPPFGMAVDANDNLYIADFGNARIRKVSTAGIITTVAGGGVSSPGDGGPANAAQLVAPAGVAVDASGNLFIADLGDNRIRKVSAGGVISTVAGNGSYGYSGDGGPAIYAELKGPGGVAVDTAGNLYIADSRNNRIRRVARTGVITTVAGGGSDAVDKDGAPATSTFIGAAGVAVDPAGNLYIADDSGCKCIWKLSSGRITTIAGGRLNELFGGSGDGGRAIKASLEGPIGVTVDSTGNIYIADGPLIRKVSAAGSINSVAGGGDWCTSRDGGPAGRARLSSPTDVAVDTGGNIYISGGPIWKVSVTGLITGVLGEARQCSSGNLLAVDTGQNIYFSDPSNHRVRKISVSGAITTVAGTGLAGYSGDEGLATDAQLNSPIGVAVDASGNLYIADAENHRIRKVSTTGTITTVAGNGSKAYAGDGAEATHAGFGGLGRVAVGAGGNLYVTDGHRIRRISAAGIINTVAGNGSGGFSGDGGPAISAELYFPGGMAVDARGNLYFADAANNRIRRVSSAGIITTIAGDSVSGIPHASGYSGDGGPATSAQLHTPVAVAVAGDGKIYIADMVNDAIRVLTLAPPPRVAQGNGRGGIRTAFRSVSPRLTSSANIANGN